MSIPRSSLRKPVMVLVISILILVLGMNAARQISIELMPSMDIPYIIVNTTYEGASPEEVEEKVTKILESSVAAVAGIEKLSSTSSKGSSRITLQFSMDTNLDEAASTIRDRIDLVKRYLPTDVQTPLVVKMDLSLMPLLILSFDSPTRTPEELKVLATDNVTPRLEQIEGIASTSVLGGRTRAIRIDIPKNNLENYGLSFSSLAQIIGAQNSNSSVGTIKDNGFEYVIESSGTYKSVDEIADTVISYKAASDGSMKEIRLGEIAEVYDGFKEQDSIFRQSGRDSIGIIVTKQAKKNSVKTAAAVLNELDTIRQALPSDCKLDVLYNTADDINNSIKQVESSALEGIVLAIIILLVFLRSGRSTIIIGISIPLSVILTLLVMFYAGLTLNMMTLAGLALGVGMLVDNSIVILENIYSYRERGTKPGVAAVLGAEEMSSAITSSTLTTVCVFLPMILYERQLGMAGQIFEDLALTVIISLLSSLVLAITLVPVLAGKYLVAGNLGKNSRHGFVYNFMGKILDGIDYVYSKIFNFVFKHKVLFTLLIIVLFVFAVSMIGVLGFNYMPQTDEVDLQVSLEMPKGTDLNTTSEALTRYTDEARKILKGVNWEAIIAGSGLSGYSSGDSATGTIMYEFFMKSKREPGWDSARTAKDKLDGIASRFPEAKITVTVDSGMSSMSGGGSSGDLAFTVSSNSLDDVRSTARELKALLEDECTDYIKDITSDLEEGLPQISITYDRQKMYSLGINIASVNSELKASVGGLTVGRYSDGGSNIDIIANLPKKDRSTVDDLENIMVTSSFGYQVPLMAFADIRETRGPLKVTRENQSRVVTINANVANGLSVTKAKDAVQAIIEEKLLPPTGTIISYGGSYKETVKFLKLFIEIIAIAILLVYSIMASQFENFKSPFIVLFTLPLGLIGVVAMYVLYGTPLNIITAVGVLILVGVVVNNGIVLVDYTNLLRERGLKLGEACTIAAKTRLRPILMTTLTTILALVPMAFFPGDGGEMVQHIGLTVFGGLTFGTLMTLFLIPCLYYFFSRRRARKAGEL